MRGFGSFASEREEGKEKEEEEEEEEEKAGFCELEARDIFFFFPIVCHSAILENTFASSSVSNALLNASLFPFAFRDT